MTRVSSTSVSTTAAPGTLHRLLTDTVAWRVWSPHVASVRASSPVIGEEWVGQVRAFFSPVATTMRITWLASDRGYDWESTLGPWRLSYRNRIAPEGDGARLDWVAELDGPAAGLLARLTGPLSAYGQRRRVARLARAAELVEEHR